MLLNKGASKYNPTRQPINGNTILKRPMSSTKILRHDEDHLRRQNTFPGTDKTISLAQCKGSTIQVFLLSCKKECFPQLQRNIKYAQDIRTRCHTLFDSVDGNNVPNLPTILDQQELHFYIATDNCAQGISQVVSAILGDHKYSETTDVTEQCFNRKDNSVTPGKDCSCLIQFLHEDEITVHGSPRQFRVQNTPKDSSTSFIRRELTKMLGEELFSYAEEVQKLIDDKIAMSPTPDENPMLQKTKEAVTVLLTRRAVPGCKTSAADGSTKCEIPEYIDSALNRMTDRGVMAFGLFGDRFVVFLDENCEDKVQTETTKEILELCHKQSKFNLPVDVVTASKNFLNDTGLKQGDAILKSHTGIESIGIVTKATKPITAEAAKGAEGPTTSQTEQETHKNIVVAITAGHLFTENDDAFFIENGEMKKFGKCLTSLHRSEDTSTMQYDIAVIEVDETITTSKHCDLKFRDDSGKSCDGVLFKGTLACGSAVYKIGAATGMTEGVVVSSDFRLTGLVNTQKAYLIKGRDDRSFSEVGDSGSIVFSLDANDEECRTVDLVSIVSKVMPEVVTRKLEIPFPLSYSVRLDKCLEKLSELNGVTIHMPEK